MVSENRIRLGKWNVFYTMAGGGPPLLFIHGSYLSSFIWHKNFPAFATSFKVYAPDLPNYGKTFTSFSRGLPDMISFHVEFLQKLNLGQVIIVAESSGGGLAIQLAAAYPHLVNKMCLVAPSGLPPAELPKPVEIGSTEWDWFLERSFEDKNIVSDEALKKTIMEDLKIASANEKGPQYQLKAEYYTRGLLQEMARVSCPTMLVWGRNDPVFPVECIERFKKIMPSIQKTLIIEKARHLPFFEFPDLFNESVSDFFTE